MFRSIHIVQPTEDYAYLAKLVSWTLKSNLLRMEPVHQILSPVKENLTKSIFVWHQVMSHLLVVALTPSSLNLRTKLILMMQRGHRNPTNSLSLTRALNNASNRALRRILLSRAQPSPEALNRSFSRHCICFQADIGTVGTLFDH